MSVGDDSGAKVGDTSGATVGQVFERHGITAEYLAGKLKDELGALVTKTLKIKGQVQDALPPGCWIVCESEEETIIQWEEINWGVQQAGRMDACKLLGLYPAAKLDLTTHSHEDALDELE